MRSSLATLVLLVALVASAVWAADPKANKATSPHKPSLTVDTGRPSLAAPPSPSVPAPLTRSHSAPVLPVPPSLPAECISGDKTKPCLMIWHAGPRDAAPRVPYNSVLAAIKRHGVGHTAMWLCKNKVSKYDSTNARCYASWWPAGGTAGIGKSDIYGPAAPHTYAQDLDANIGEGHPPDVVIALDGWDPACLETHFNDVILRPPSGAPVYKALGRNCVCVVVELLKQCPREESQRGEIAIETLEGLSAWTQFPSTLNAFALAYAANRDACRCDSASSDSEDGTTTCRLIRSASSYDAAEADSGTPGAPPNSPLDRRASLPSNKAPRVPPLPRSPSADSISAPNSPRSGSGTPTTPGTPTSSVYGTPNAPSPRSTPSGTPRSSSSSPIMFGRHI